MTKYPIYAFLTGLYFSTLQFCYLILLQMNISSAYMTYMVITTSWLIGSIAGLWLEKLETILTKQVTKMDPSIEYFNNQYRKDSVDRLILSGGGVGLKGSRAYFWQRSGLAKHLEIFAARFEELTCVPRYKINSI
jgi:hypothetical protein